MTKCVFSYTSWLMTYWCTWRNSVQTTRTYCTERLKN